MDLAITGTKNPAAGPGLGFAIVCLFELKTSNTYNHIHVHQESYALNLESPPLLVPFDICNTANGNHVVEL